jgi:cytochrome b subunit of formate dehydrogenase
LYLTIIFVFRGSLALSAEKAGGTDCATCHEQGQKVAKSAHASVACGQCHERHDQVPHPENVPKPVCGTCHATEGGDYAKSVHGQAAKKGNAGAPDCGMCHGAAHETVSTKTGDFHKNVPNTCGMCHAEVAEHFNASVHGKAVARGVTDAPVCTDCHGEHSILSPKNVESTVHSRQIRDTCARCHADVRLSKKFGLPPDRIVSFDSSFHGLAAKSGSQTVANCSSCHGFHDILASSDAKSMTNPKNLPKTCGNCHPGAGVRFALGKVHWVEGESGPQSVQWIRLGYMLLIPLTIGYMMLHHGGDWVRKLIRMRLNPPANVPISYPVRNPEIRMLPFERVQHILLVVSFMTLAWSGFALKYPDQWWARPLVQHEGIYPLRGLIHRIAAVTMVIVGLMHAVSLMVSRRLRNHWLELIPVVRDAHEAIGVLLYNLGILRKKPAVSAHSYVAKMEYWAVVWGTFVMGLTGFMLWANNWTLRLIPREWLDVATAVHLYEAILASLAILVWHLYTVIFDPDVYPMDTAWLTGKSVRKPEGHHHGEHKKAPEAAPSEAKGD